MRAECGGVIELVAWDDDLSPARRARCLRGRTKIASGVAAAFASRCGVALAGELLCFDDDMPARAGQRVYQTSWSASPDPERGERIAREWLRSLL